MEGAEMSGVSKPKESGWRLFKERVPFYGCIQKNASQEMYELSLEILEQLKAA